MVQQGRDAGTEVCLFTGPRAAWGTGRPGDGLAGRVIAGSLRGLDELRAGLLDVVHAAELGVRSVLVSDLGQLAVLGRMRAAGDLPKDFVLKVSISLPVGNPATARVLEDLGASTLNLPVDLAVTDIAAIRAAVDGAARHLHRGGGRLRRSGALPRPARDRPGRGSVYVKFTVRNAPGTYPSGGHLAPVVLALAAERVRRASIGLALLARTAPASGPARRAEPGSPPKARAEPQPARARLRLTAGKAVQRAAATTESSTSRTASPARATLSSTVRC